MFSNQGGEAINKTKSTLQSQPGSKQPAVSFQAQKAQPESARMLDNNVLGISMLSWQCFTFQVFIKQRVLQNAMILKAINIPCLENIWQEEYLYLQL